ncbi:hypothetical protein, partial [Campylobacter magnus]|uniref:hypothetical protein n=1 Tax=Campylobacter magnus TaxID=3026462 RepID=UPI0026E05FE2
ADAEGVEFWANALASGTSKGALLAQFTAAALSDPNSDDAQTLNAKVNVANAITAKFNNFNADVTADQKKAALDALKATMTEVVAGSTVEEFQDTINQFKGQNQDRKTDVFTKGEDDLDASESTAATTFRGTINISDSEKSTIQAGDTATGNSEYAPANTLIVDVKSDGKEKDFNFGRDMKATINNVDNLTINNGTADVTLNLDGTTANFGGKVAITGKGDKADVTVAQDVASLNVSTSGTKKAYADTTVAANATLGSFEGSAAVDTLNINGTIEKSINTGDGADEVTLDTNAKVFEKATISLGGGDDTLTISTNNIGLENANGAITENLKASVTIDGGAGTKDKLILQNDISAGVKAITGIETIKAENSGLITAAISSAVADGLKTSVEGILTVKADYTNTKTIDLRGIKAVKNDAKDDQGWLTLSGITYENITLSSNIKENIVVKAHTADDPKNYAEINKFGDGDTIKVDTLSGDATQVKDKALDLTRYADVKSTLLGKTTGDVVAINDVNGKKAYIWQVLDSNDARLVAIVDKKLKVDGTSFVYDNSKTTPEEQGSLSTISYVSGSTTLDINKGIYGEGTATQQFNSPANEKDVLEVALRTVDGNAPGALTVTDSGDNKGTVKVYVMDKANGASDINLTGVNGEIYLGAKSGIINLDASNYTFTGVNTVTAITSGELKVKADQFTASKTLDLSKVKANVIVNDLAVDTNNINLGTSIVSGDASDKVAIKIASVGQSDKTVTATTAADTITLASGASNAVTIDLGVDTSADTLVHLATTLTGLKGDTITNFKSQDKIDLKALQLGASLTTKAATADGHVKFENGSLYTVAINKAAASIAVNTDIVAASKVFDEGAGGVTANAKGLLVVKTTETSGNKWQVYAIKNDGNTTLATSEVKLVATLDGDFTASNYVGA